MNNLKINNIIKSHLISILLPIHNEEKTINPFFKSLSETLDSLALNLEFEIICINDGSTDNTLEELKSVKPRIRGMSILSFSRNFGKESAMKAGLDYAKGDCSIIMDCDFEDPLDLIPSMISKWQEGYDIVYTVRSQRKEGVIKRGTAFGFYKLINFFSDIKIHENAGDFRLFDRKVVEALNTLNEINRFSKGLFNWVGFKSVPLYYVREKRPFGKTSWNYFSLWQYALDGIFSFSTMPLKVSTYIGGICSLFALMYGAFIVVKTLLFDIDVPGYASIITIILFFNGLLFINLGILGEYISRIFLETKRRPHYLIEEYIHE